MSYISSCRVASGEEGGEEPSDTVEENGDEAPEAEGGDEAPEAEGGDEDENRDEL